MDYIDIPSVQVPEGSPLFDLFAEHMAGAMNMTKEDVAKLFDLKQ